jgi:hypothetical protein
MENEDFLDLSNERDVWMARLAAAEKAGYERGFENGLERGRREYFAERESDWEALKFFRLNALFKQPDYVEMEKYRYGPGGKLMAGEPRDGDYTGGPVEW